MLPSFICWDEAVRRSMTWRGAISESSASSAHQWDTAVLVGLHLLWLQPLGVPFVSIDGCQSCAWQSSSQFLQVLWLAPWQRGITSSMVPPKKCAIFPRVSPWGEIMWSNVCPCLSGLVPPSPSGNLINTERGLHEQFLQKWLEGRGEDFPLHTPTSQIAELTATLSRTLLMCKLYGNATLSSHDAGPNFSVLYCQKLHGACS